MGVDTTTREHHKPYLQVLGSMYAHSKGESTIAGMLSPSPKILQCPPRHVVGSHFQCDLCQKRLPEMRTSSHADGATSMSARMNFCCLPMCAAWAAAVRYNSWHFLWTPKKLSSAQHARSHQIRRASHSTPTSWWFCLEMSSTDISSRLASPPSRRYKKMGKEERRWARRVMCFPLRISRKRKFVADTSAAKWSWREQSKRWTSKRKENK